MLFDVRLAVRALVRQAGLSAAVVVTVGLALAANTALFSVFDGLLFRPLPYANPDRLVQIEFPGEIARSLAAGEDDRVRDAIASTPLLAERAYTRPRRLFDSSAEAVVEWRVQPYAVSPSLATMLGVEPVMGRWLEPADALGEPRETGVWTVVLGYDIWQSRLGADPSVVGQTIELPGASPGQRFHVAGVMPAGFSFPSGANLWLPPYRSFAIELLGPPSYGRLAAGASIEAIRAISPHLIVTSLREHLRPDGAFALAVLLVATGLLLVVAWVQVAGLIVARAVARMSEVGVRIALGAGRGALARQFLVEGGLLVLLAVACGWVATPVVTRATVALLPAEMTVGQSVEPDARALWYTAACAAIGCLVLAAAPAGLLRHVAPLDLLRGYVAGAAPRAGRLRTAFFVTQLSMAAALVYLTGLAFQTFLNVSRSDLGFEPRGLVVMPMPRYDAPPGTAAEAQRTGRADRDRRVFETVAAVRALPEVLAVSSGDWPMQPGGLLQAELRSASDPAGMATAGREATAAPGYASVLGLALSAGREAGPDELATTWPMPALVNEAFARRLRPFGSVVGQIVSASPSRHYRVTGVLPDVRMERPDASAVPTLFKSPPAGVAPALLVVRLRPGVTPEAAGLPDVVRRIWGGEARPIGIVDDAVRASTVGYRARTTLLALIAVLCLPLTMVGVAGALGFATRQRTREIAIRLALGAEPGAEQRRVIGQAMAAAGVALMVGIGLGAGVGRVMSSFLYGVSPLDVRVVAGAAVVVLAVAGLAAYPAARRAARISPALALRE